MLHIAPNGMSHKLQNGEQKIVSLSRFMSYLSLSSPSSSPPPSLCPYSYLSPPPYSEFLQYLFGNASWWLSLIKCHGVVSR